MDDAAPAVAPIVLCAAAVGALLIAEGFDSAPGRAAAKLTASSAFVWAALLWGATASGYGMLMLTGLVLCWAGDALLLPGGNGRAFQLGIGSFLLGHVAYAVACTRLSLDTGWLVVCGGLVGTAGLAVHRWLRPHVPPDFRAPVCAYLVVIAVMLTFASAASLSGGPGLLGVGALGFAASDVSVARDRFVAPGFANGAWGLPVYFASQLALAFTVGAAAV
jgi:uncharacterized membrane protein YhhN